MKSTRLVKTLFAIFASFAASATLADEPAPDALGIPDDIEVVTNAAPIVAETLFADGSTNTWTQSDLTDALGLMNRKYHRDIESSDGRAQWHGKRLSEYYLAGEDGTKRLVQLYEDGFVWTNAPQRVRVHADPEAAAKAKAAAEKRRAEFERAHLPPEVAALLAARRAAATTNEVTVTITP